MKSITSLAVRLALMVVGATFVAILAHAGPNLP